MIIICYWCTVSVKVLSKAMIRNRFAVGFFYIQGVT